MIIVSVRDKKAEAYGPIYATQNQAVAVRDFSQGCQDTKSNLYQFPEDYELHQLAELDQYSGKITPNIKILTTAEMFVEKKENKKCQDEQK